MKDQMGTEIQVGDLVAFTDGTHSLHIQPVAKVTKVFVHIGDPVLHRYYNKRRADCVIVVKKKDENNR